jgi:hypothetical protein
MAEWIVEPGKLPRPAEPRDQNPFDRLEGEEAERLRRFIEWLSDWMDAKFEIPVLRWRFGLDAVAGLVPGVGDLATTAVSLFLIALAGRFGLPRITIARMTLNVLIDMLVGALPLVGDVFDVWWKANLRNAQLLSERVDAVGGSRRDRAADWLFVSLMLALLVAVFVGLVALGIFLATAAWHALQSAFA